MGNKEIKIQVKEKEGKDTCIDVQPGWPKVKSQMDWVNWVKDHDLSLEDNRRAALKLAK